MKYHIDTKKNLSILVHLVLIMMLLNNIASHGQTNFLHQEQPTVPYTFNKFNENLHNSSTKVISYLLGKNKILATYTLELNDRCNVIIQLNSPPLSEVPQQNYNKLTLNTTIELEQTRFKNDIRMIERQLNSHSLIKNSSIEIDIIYTYKEIFNGIALQTSISVLREIENLPYVKNIFHDTKLTLALNESIPIIRVDELRNQFSLSGEGVIIGIIDTGIDYTHPDLGGGIGAEYKVIGGYDFVNKDSDPLDDHGHGTHVAGIIGSENETLTGVAPGAKLMSYKIVNAHGEGYSSALLAALERALNPDRNPNTDDAVDIVNISLACPGHEDDAIAQAIDNAVNAGLICVVAAGNEGEYFTITSPGVSKKAITVGAADKNYKINPTSSKGPALNYYTIKPDIVAPGKHIQSTWLNGGYHQSSGTSMATAHVAGVAALLKQLHPDWSHDMIKATLMNGAIDIGFDPFVQGCGQIDAFRSAMLQTVIQPASLSYGIDDLGKNGTWIQKDTITINNFGDIEKDYHITVASNLPIGTNLSFQPDNVKIAPKTKANIEIVLEVENANTALLFTEPYAYHGRIKVVSITDTISIPFAFLRTSFMRLNLSEKPKLGILIHNRKDFGFAVNPHGNNVNLIVPPDKYDIIVNYNQFYHVIKENELLEDMLLLDLPLNEAKNQVQINGYDQNGIHLTGNFQRNLLHFYHQKSGYGMIFNYVYSVDLFTTSPYFSDFSKDYLFEYILDCNPQPGISYQIYDHIEGLNTNIYLQNDPGDFNHFHLKFNLQQDQENFLLTKWLGWGYSDFNEAPVFTIHYHSFDDLLNKPLVHEAYYMPIENLACPFLSFYTTHNLDAIAPISDTTFTIKTPYISAVDTSTLIGKIYSKQFPIVFTNTNHLLSFGYGAPFWSGKFENKTDAICFYPSIGMGKNLFFDQMYGMKTENELLYQLFQNNVLMQSGNLSSIMDAQQNSNITQVNIEPGTYKMNIAYDNYAIHDKQGYIQVRSEFSTGDLYPDKSPPYLTNFKILSDGIISDRLQHTRDNRIEFTMQDDIFLWETKLSYQNENDTTWHPLSIVTTENTNHALLPDSIYKGFINLKIYAVDFAQNKLECNINPAFNIPNSAPTAFDLVSPLDGDTVMTAHPEFLWHIATDPDNDPITYSLFLSEDSCFSDFAHNYYMKNIKKNSYLFPDSLEDNSSYYWKIQANDGFGGTCTSTRANRFWLNYFNDTPMIYGLPDTSFFEDDSLILFLNKYLNDADNHIYELELVIEIVAIPVMANNPATDRPKHVYIEKNLVDNSKINPVTMTDSEEDNGNIIFDDVVIFIFDYAHQQDSISVFINSKKNVAKFKSSANWYGPPIPFIFTATDPDGLSNSDTMTVQVLPVNDAPVLSALPEIIFSEDNMHLLPVSSWFPYVNDIDNDDATLSWNITEKKNIRAQIQNKIVYFTTPADWFGSEILRVKVEDSGGLKDSTSLHVTITPINDTPVITPIPDTSFQIGKTLELNLNNYVFDVDDADSSLVWSISGNDSIMISYDNRLHIATVSSRYFIGSESIDFRVNDPYGASAEQQVNILVKPPDKFTLFQNYPNPFNNVTQFEFALPAESHVKMAIFNLLGQKVTVIIDQQMKAGLHRLSWDCRNDTGIIVSSGVYFYQLISKTGDTQFVETKKMILLH